METFIFFTTLFVIIIMFVLEMWISFLNYNNKDAPIPLEVVDVYDNDKYSKWLNYNMENFRIGKIEGAISFGLLLSLLIFGVFPYINDLTIELSSNSYIQVLLFFLFFYIITYILGIGFKYYRTFSIENRYGFNKTTKKVFIVDQIKSIVLTIIFGGGLIYLLMVLFENTGSWFYLTSILSIIFITTFINIFYVKLILPIFNKLTPLEEGELKDELISFAEKVGYEVNKISIMNASKRSTKLNAFFSGIGKFKQIVLYDTLLQKLQTKEIVAVLAHEIGHAKLKHVYKLMLNSIISILIYIGLLMFMLNSDVFSLAFGFDDVHFGFVLIIFSILVSPLSTLIGLINNRRSRKYEFEADNFAAVNGYKTEMESALKVLTKENFGNLTPHKLYVDLYYSHPPTAQRIKMIRTVK